MKPEAVLNILGLANRAHGLIAGTMAVERAVLNNKAFLLFIASDCGESVGKHWRMIAAEKNTPTILVFSKKQLGDAIGKTPKTIVAITNEGFAGAIRRQNEN